MDEPGDQLSDQADWERKRASEERKRLNNEPYEVYICGLGWVPPEQANTEG